MLMCATLFKWITPLLMHMGTNVACMVVSVVLKSHPYFSHPPASGDVFQSMFNPMIGQFRCIIPVTEWSHRCDPPPPEAGSEESFLPARVCSVPIPQPFHLLVLPTSSEAGIPSQPRGNDELVRRLWLSEYLKVTKTAHERALSRSCRRSNQSGRRGTCTDSPAAAAAAALFVLPRSAEELEDSEGFMRFASLDAVSLPQRVAPFTPQPGSETNERFSSGFPTLQACNTKIVAECAFSRWPFSVSWWVGIDKPTVL